MMDRKTKIALVTLAVIALIQVSAMLALAQQPGAAGPPAAAPAPVVIDFKAYEAQRVILAERVRAGEITAEQAIAEIAPLAAATKLDTSPTYATYTRPNTIGTFLLRAGKIAEALPHFLEAKHYGNAYACYVALRDDENALKYALLQFEFAKSRNVPVSARRYLQGAIRLMLKSETVDVNAVLDMYKELYLCGITTPDQALEIWRDMYTLCRQAQAPDRQKQLELCNVILRLFPPPPAAGESPAIVEEQWRGFTSIVKRMQKELQTQLLNEPQ